MVAPPALGKNFSFFSTLAQEMASVSTPATFALFDALATDAKVAPPDEPTLAPDKRMGRALGLVPPPQRHVVTNHH